MGQPVRRIIGDANGIRFVFERNHAKDRAKDFFTFDGHAGHNIGKNSRLHIVAAVETIRTAKAARHKSRLNAAIKALA